MPLTLSIGMNKKILQLQTQMHLCDNQYFNKK